ncbi:MAG: hypothetical protein M3137_18935 [Actinomycetota bacterium]|nr:hypothetical protein [Actinomycetota bacterium]
MSRISGIEAKSALRPLAVILALTVLAGCTDTRTTAIRDDPDAAAQWDSLFGRHVRPAVLQEGLGPIHMPVTTTNPEAQRWFDQGLAQLFGFAHEDAIRSFEKTLQLDPGLAIANWGIAYAYGPNINLGMDAWRATRANEALSRALGHTGEAGPLERALVDSLTVRYSSDRSIDPFGTSSRAPLDRAYWERMQAVMAAFPDNTNVATLTAEAGLDLIPWRAWDYNGKPTLPVVETATPAIPEVLQVKEILESVMARDPDHIGALHYYIHAVEASQDPALALPAAARLKSIAWGQAHLVHAASHIYARVGDWGSAMVSGDDAVVQDERYHERVGNDDLYWVAHGDHNLYFQTSVLSNGGRGRETAVRAHELDQRVRKQLYVTPEQEYLLPMEQSFSVRFHEWAKVLAYPQPQRRFKATLAFWHINRGIALAATGDVAGARSELRATEDVLQSQDPPRLADARYEFQNNPASALVELDMDLLRGRIAEVGDDAQAADAAYQSAVRRFDTLYYDEPPPFYYPVRETYGGFLLRAGRPEDAEAVFRSDLVAFPNNGRSLFGLSQALDAQGEPSADVGARFDVAWRWADTPLSAYSLD